MGLLIAKGVARLSSCSESIAKQEKDFLVKAIVPQYGRINFSQGPPSNKSEDIF